MSVALHIPLGFSIKGVPSSQAAAHCRGFSHLETGRGSGRPVGARVFPLAPAAGERVPHAAFARTVGTPARCWHKWSCRRLPAAGAEPSPPPPVHKAAMVGLTRTKLKGLNTSMKSSLHWSVKSASFRRLFSMEFTSCNLQNRATSPAFPLRPPAQGLPPGSSPSANSALPHRRCLINACSLQGGGNVLPTGSL